MPGVQVLVARIQGPDSPFAAYVANLPVGVSGVPMFYPREALEAIEYPPVVEQVRTDVCSSMYPCIHVLRNVEVLHSCVHGFKKVNAGMYRRPPMVEPVGACMYFSSAGLWQV